MLYKPLKPQRIKPMAFITDATPTEITITTEWGLERASGIKGGLLLYSYDQHVIYSLVKPKQLCAFSGFHNWKIVRYHGRIVRIIYNDDISIHPLSTFGPDPQALLPLFDRMRDIGVSPNAISTMAMASWRRLLDDAIWIKEWPIRETYVGRKAFIGGRKEALYAPSRYSGVWGIDLPAAYINAQRIPYPTRLAKTRHPQWCESGIAYATVKVPEGLEWNPLPMSMGRTRNGNDIQCYGNGRTTGIYTFEELQIARDVGSAVILHATWRGFRHEEIFKSWIDFALELRSLEGQAGKLGKQLTTRLWSMFAINPQHKKEIVWWSDKKGKERHTLPGPATPNFTDTAFISAITSSRVRARLYRDALMPGGAVYADTDGAMVPWGICPEGWTVKQEMEEVEIKAAQAYRWKCRDCGVIEGHPAWHYSVAGIPQSRLAEVIFERLPANYMFDLRSQSITIKQQMRPEWQDDPLEDEAL